MVQRRPLWARKMLEANQHQSRQVQQVAEPEDRAGFQEPLGDQGLVFCLLPNFNDKHTARRGDWEAFAQQWEAFANEAEEPLRKAFAATAVDAAKSKVSSYGDMYKTCRTALIYVPDEDGDLQVASVAVYAELGSQRPSIKHPSRKHFPSKDRAFVVLFIHTLSHYKRKGLAALMVASIKAMAAEKGHKYFFASVLSESKRAGTVAAGRAAGQFWTHCRLYGSREGGDWGCGDYKNQPDNYVKLVNEARETFMNKQTSIWSACDMETDLARCLARATRKLNPELNLPGSDDEDHQPNQGGDAGAPAAAARGVWGGIQAVGAAVLAGGQALVAAADGMIRALTPGKRRADRPARARSPHDPELGPRELAAEDFEDEIEPAPLGKLRVPTAQQRAAIRARLARNQGAVPAAQAAGMAAAGPSHGGQRQPPAAVGPSHGGQRQPPAAASGAGAGQVQAAGGTRRGGDRQVEPEAIGGRPQSRTRAAVRPSPQRAVLGRRNIPAPRRKRAPRQKPAPAAAAGPSARPAPAAMGRYIMDDNGVMHAVVSSDEEREDDDDDDVIRDDGDVEDEEEEQENSRRRRRRRTVRDDDEEEEEDSEATEDEPLVAHAVQQRGKRQRVGGAPAPRAGRRGAAAGGTGQTVAARGSPGLADGALRTLADVALRGQPPAPRAGGLAQGVPQPSPRQRPVLLPGAPAHGASPRSLVGGMPAGKLPRGLLLPRTLARGGADGAPRTMAHGPPLPLAPLAPLAPVGVAPPQAAAGGGAPVPGGMAPQGLVRRAPPQGPLAVGRAISQDVLNDLLDWCEGDPPATLEDNTECKQIFIRARAAGLTPWQFLRGLEAVAGHYNIGGCIYECLAGIMQGPQDDMQEPDLDADVAAVPPAAAHGVRGAKRSRLAGPAAPATSAGPSARPQPLAAGGSAAGNGLGGVPIAAAQEQPDEAMSDEDAAPPPRRAPRHKTGPAADNAAAAGGTGVAAAAAAQPPGPSQLLGDATRPRGRSTPVPQQVAAPPGRALRGRQTDPPAPITSLQCNAVAVITSADDVAAIVEGAKGVSQRAAAGRKPMATRHAAVQPNAAMTVDPAGDRPAQAVHAAFDAADAPAAVPDLPPAPVPELPPRQVQFLQRLRRAKEAAPARPLPNTSQTTLQPLSAAPAPLAPAPAPTAGPSRAPVQQAPPGAPAPAQAATPGPTTTITTTTQTNTVAPAPATTIAPPAAAPNGAAGPTPAPPPHLQTTPAGNLTCAQPPSRTNPSRIASWFSGGRKRPLTPGPVEQGAQAKKPRAGEQGV